MQIYEALRRSYLLFVTNTNPRISAAFFDVDRSHLTQLEFVLNAGNCKFMLFWNGKAIETSSNQNQSKGWTDMVTT